MVIIEIKFDGKEKVYQYLLVNPGKYKIDKTKSLYCEVGSFMDKPMFKKLTPVKAYKVASLPSIVTSQIVLLDNDNHIVIQKIGSLGEVKAEITETFKETSKAREGVKKVFKDEELQLLYEESLREVKEMNSASVSKYARFLASTR